MKGIACLLILLALAAGCTTKGKSKEQARRAYLSGQQQGRAQMQPQTPFVYVMGNVANHTIPLTDDMTLARALVFAQYLGAGNPTEIVVVRNGLATNIDPTELLHGHDVKVEANDRIEIHP
ncbi:MAG: hypothetical protein JWQ71_1391 [Pedosphaera sp.]|nr:hypothetical protein [Pedosphaera sp.]